MKAQTAIPHGSTANSCRHSYMQEDLHADTYCGHAHHVDTPAHWLMAHMNIPTWDSLPLPSGLSNLGQLPTTPGLRQVCLSRLSHSRGDRVSMSTHKNDCRLAECVRTHKDTEEDMPDFPRDTAGRSTRYLVFYSRKLQCLPCLWNSPYAKQSTLTGSKRSQLETAYIPLQVPH